MEEVASGVSADGSLIAHTWGTELILVASGLQDGATYLVTFHAVDGRDVPAGTFIGTGQDPLTCRLNSALLREDAAGFTVATFEGEPVLRADLP